MAILGTWNSKWNRKWSFSSMDLISQMAHIKMNAIDPRTHGRDACPPVFTASLCIIIKVGNNLSKSDKWVKIFISCSH